MCLSLHLKESVEGCKHRDAEAEAEEQLPPQKYKWIPSATIPSTPQSPRLTPQYLYHPHPRPRPYAAVVSE